MEQPTPPHDDNTPDLLERYALRAKAQLQTMRFGKHVKRHAGHYAHALVDESGALRSDSFLVTDPQEHAAFVAKKKEIGEIGINIEANDEFVLKHLIESEPLDSSLLNKTYYQAKDYGLDLPLETFTHRPAPLSVPAEPARGTQQQPPVRNTDSPELRERRTLASDILQQRFIDHRGDLKMEGPFTRPAIRQSLVAKSEKIGSDLGLAMPVSHLNAARQLLDDPDPRVGHELREALIRHGKSEKPVLGKHTRHVAHVTDDPEVAKRIHGDGATR